MAPETQSSSQREDQVTALQVLCGFISGQVSHSYLQMNVLLPSIRRQGGREVLLPQKAAQRGYSPTTRMLDKGQFSRFSHHFWPSPWTSMLPVEHPVSAQALTTLLFVLTNESESKQDTECFHQFYVAHSFPRSNNLSAVQRSITLQPSSSKTRHYLEHFVKFFCIKITAHLQTGFQSLDKFYPLPQKPI